MGGRRLKLYVAHPGAWVLDEARFRILAQFELCYQYNVCVRTSFQLTPAPYEKAQTSEEMIYMQAVYVRARTYAMHFHKNCSPVASLI